MPFQVTTLTIPILNDRLRRGRTEELLEEKFLVPTFIAQYILDNYNRNNRKLDPQTVAAYARDMENGRWNDSNGDMLKFSNDDKFFNGQHTLSAIVKTNMPRVLSFKFGLPPEAAATNDRPKTRSTGQQLATLGIKHGFKKDAAASMLYGFVNNPKRPHSYRMGHKPSSQERDFYAIKYSVEMDAVLDNMHSLGLSNVLLDSYCAFIYVILRHTKHKEKIPLFLEKFGGGANLASDDPILVVRNKIMGNQDFYKNPNNKDATLALVFRAWNMFNENKKTSPKNFKSPSEIPVIYGLEEFEGKKLYAKQKKP